MFFHHMFGRNTNWDNQDYRDYLDHRTRSKRRLRRRLTVGVTLLVCLLLVLALGTVNATVRVQPPQPKEIVPAPAAPGRLLAPGDRAARRDSQRLRAQAPATSQNPRSSHTAAAPPNAAQAAWLLGLIHLHGGSSVARDPIQAALWFERARMLGKPLPKARLAWCEIERCQRPPDQTGARRENAQLRSNNPTRAD
jgi:hypothetical protein